MIVVSVIVAGASFAAVAVLPSVCAVAGVSAVAADGEKLQLWQVGPSR